MLGKDRAVVILLFIFGWVDWESLGGVGHLFVGNGLGCDLLQGVDPRVAYTIAELLLLAPGYGFGQHVGKGLAYNLLLNGFAWAHLGFGVGAHGHIQELLVEEWHTTLNTPCRKALVGTQTVVEVQLRELANGFLMKVLGRWGFVEVQVATENLVGTFAAEYHLDTHRLDDTRQQIHRC